MTRTPHRPVALAALLWACAVLLALAPDARALVDGTPQTLWKKHTVQGGSTIIGNTVISSTSGGVVNDVLLAPSDTVATLSGVPNDATLVGAYAFWSGSLRPGDQADQLVDLQLPDGTTAPNILVDTCRTLLRNGNGISTAYYCRADVTSVVRAHLARLPDGTTSLNGTYNVANMFARPGTPSGPGGTCNDPDDPCQSAFGGWSMILVWSSPTSANTKEIMVYDGFLRMDELCDPDRPPPGPASCLGGGSSGVSPPITLGGFNAVSRNAELSFFALEGDRQLGSPPEPAQNADFMRFAGVELSDSALGVFPKNLFNSVIFNRQGGTPFSGVDIKTLNAQLPAPSGFPPLTTSVQVQPGSGDGVPDVGPFYSSQGFVSNGELFYLGAMMLSVETVAPNFRNSSKRVDRTTAAPGDTLTYTIHVENSGTWPSNASVKDALPATLDYVAGSTTLDGSAVADVNGQSPLFTGSGLGVGQLSPVPIPGLKNAVDVTFRARIKPAVTSGTICNTGEVDATYQVPGNPSVTLPPVPVKTDPCTTVQTPNLQRPTLSVVDNSNTPPQPGTPTAPGHKLFYTLTLTNSGAQAASGLNFVADLPPFVKNFQLITPVPAGATNVSTTTGGANGTGQVAFNNVSVPGNGAQVLVIFSVDVLSDAEYTAAGGTDGQSLSIQARLSGSAVNTTNSVSDDPNTTVNPDPTVIKVQFGVDLGRSTKTVTGDTGGFVTPGQLLTYTIHLANAGSQPATASVNDDLPPNVGNCQVISGPVTCSAGGANGTGKVTGSSIGVAAGQSVDAVFTVSVVANAADGAQITNIGQVSATQRPGVTWQVRSPTVTVKSQVVFVSTKTVSDINGGNVDPGDDLLYTIQVRNAGSRASGAISITDPLDPNLTFTSADNGGTLSGGTVRWSLPGLNAGVTTSVTFRAKVNANVATGTSIANQGTVTSPEASTRTDDPNTSAVGDPTVVRIVSSPSFVDSTKTVTDVNGGQVRPGDTLQYAIAVKNSGRVIGTNVVVSDTVDPNLTIDQIQNGGVRSGSTITWTLPQLAVGATQTVVFTAKVNSPIRNGTTIANQAGISSAEVPTPVPTDDPSTTTLDDATSVKVASTVALSTSAKTVTDDNGGEPIPGDRLTWKIRVTAVGDSPATDVVVSDPIAACLANPVAQNGGQFDGKNIRWDKTTTPALANVVPGTPVELTFTATIAAGTPDGTNCANQASLASPDLPAPTLTDDPATSAANDPTVIKVVSKPVLTASTKVATLLDDANGDNAISPGDKIRYTITVKNTGSETARGVVLTDQFSALLTQVQLAGGGTLSGTTGTWNIGDLPALTDKAVTVDAVVVKPLDDGTVLDNQGSIRASNVAQPALTDDPQTPTPNDPTRIVLKSAPRFVATKTVLDVNGGRVEPGDLLRYTLKLTNTGTSLARQVKLADTLDQNLTFVTSSPAGTFDAATRTLTFTQDQLDLATELTFTVDARIAAALDNGTPIDNQARVTSTEVTTPALSDDPTTTAANDPTRVVVISAADLSTSTKTFVDRNGGDIRPGDLVDYTITVKNTGNALAKNLVVTDQLDPRLLVQQPIDGGGTVDGSGVVSWTRSTPLGLGESATYKLTVRIALPLPDATELSNQARMSVQGLVTPFVTDDPSTPTVGDPTKFKVKSAPSMSMTKTVTDVNGGDAHPGDLVRYDLTLKNTGDAEATGAVLTDVLDQNLEFDSANGGGTFDAATRTVRWTLPTIGVTTTPVLTVSARIKRPLADATVIANQASLKVAELGAATPSDDPGTPAVGDPTKFSVVAKPDISHSVKLFTDVNGGDINPEDVIEYTIQVLNTGDNAATNVVVSDVVDTLLTDVQPLDGGTWDAGSRTVRWTLPSVDLAPAGQKNVRFRAKVAPLLANGTKISNQARLVSDQTPTPALTDDLKTPAPNDPTTFTVVSSPQLQTSTKIVVDENGGLVRPGDTLLYTVVVKNSGTTYATDVVVEDPLDPVLTDIAPENGGVVQNGRIRWDKTTTPALAKLTPRSDEVTLRVRAKIGAAARNGATIANQALLSDAENVPAVTDDPGTPALGDATKITLQFPDLNRSVKTVLDENGGVVEPGDSLVYTIKLANDGTLPANDVTVDDPIDTTNLVDIQPGQGATLANGHIQWSTATTPTLARVEANSTLELTVRARVKPLTKNKTVISNQAQLLARELLLPVQTDADLATPERDATKVTVVSSPKLEASTLAVEDVNGDEARPGDLLKYTLTVRNTGNTYGTNATVTLALPPELTDVTLGGPGDLAGSTITYAPAKVSDLAQLTPGTNVTVTFTARLRSPLPNGKLVSVQGGIKVDELDQPVLTDDPATPVVGDPTTVRVFSQPRFTHSEKSITDLNGGKLEPGDTVLYEIVVVNDGTEPGTDVRLFDVVPSGLTYVPGSFTLNGQKVDDTKGFPLTNGLTVRSQRGDALPGQVVVDDGKAPDDEPAVVQYRATVSRTVLEGTTISNQAKVTSATTDPQFTDDPRTPVLGDPTVAVVGSGASIVGTRLDWKLVEDRQQPNVVNPGDLVEISIQVPNGGNAPVTCLVSNLPLDSKLQPQGDLTLNGKPITAKVGDDAGEWTTDAGKDLATVHLGEIAPQAMATVTLRARAKTGSNGVALAQAHVFCESSLDQFSDSDPSVPGAQPASIPIRDLNGTAAPELKDSMKTVEDLNGGEVMPGDELRYRITLVNDGLADASGLEITDVLPKGLTYVDASVEGDSGLRPDAQVTEGISTVTATLAALPAGKRATLTFRAKVDANVPMGKVLANVAAVRAKEVPAQNLPPASVTVGSLSGAGAVVGKVWEDLDENGTWGEKDQAYSGFQVQLVSRPTSPDQPAAVLKSVFSDAKGDYSLLSVPAGNYGLVFRAPDGTVWTSSSVQTLKAGETRVIDGQLKPMGVVYQASDNTAAKGARVFLTYDSSMVGQTPLACDDDQTTVTEALDPEIGHVTPRRVGAKCLPQGQQGQHTLDTGAYHFDLPQAKGTLPAGLRLWVVPTGSLSFPSSTHAPQDGFAPGGKVQPKARPGSDARTQPYFVKLQSSLSAGDTADVSHNHLPVDVLEEAIKITKQASRSAVRVGEFVTYTVTLTNTSTKDLVTGAAGTGGVTVVDAFPQSLRYVKGSARAVRRTLTGETCARVSGKDSSCNEGKLEPKGALEGAGRLGAFGPYDLKAGESLLVRYTLAVTGAAKPGDYDNVAHGEADGVRVTRDALASVRVMWDVLFDESTILGKVFCDDDHNGLQTPGEMGVGLARVYADNGYYVEADPEGKFHFVGLKPGMHLFKVDERSLPPGIVAGDGLRRSYYLTPGLDTRINFPVQCDLPESKADHVRLLQDIPKPPPPPPPPPPPVVVLGGTDPMELTVDGTSAKAPMAEIVLSLPDDGRSAGNNVSLGKSGQVPNELDFRVLTLPGPSARSWLFQVADDSGTVVYASTGQGQPPAVITWDGKTEQGQQVLKAGMRYQYRLKLTGGAGFAWETAPRAFGLEWNDPSLPAPVAQKPEPLVQTFGGQLFGAKDAKPKGTLISAIASLVPRIPKKEGKISVAVYADASDGKAAQKLTEERAKTILALLAAQGIDVKRVDAQGKGAADPVAQAPVAEKGKKLDQKAVQAAQAQNRRVVVSAELPAPALPPLAQVQQPAGQMAVSVADRSVATGTDGRFRQEVPREDKAFVARVVGKSGAALEAEWKPGPKVALPTGELLLQVDTKRGLAAVANSELTLPLLGSDVALGSGGIVELGDTGPRQPLRFKLAVPAAISEWQLTVRDASGLVVKQFDGKGLVPLEIAWDGLGPSKASALRPGSYTYQLTASDQFGNKLTSAKKQAMVFRAPPPLEQTFQVTDLFVKPAEAKLKPTAKKLAADVARRLAAADGSIVVEAHSDTDDNQKLDMERAGAVKQLLVDLGVPEARLTAVGRGASSPLIPNINKKARERNNRVVVRTATKLPILPEQPSAMTVRVQGQMAELMGDGIFRVTLPAAPAGPFDIALSSTNGREVSYRIAMPPPEVHDDKAGTSRKAVQGAVYAQAGDDLPPLPDMDLLPPPADPEPAAAPATAAPTSAAPVASAQPATEAASKTEPQIATAQASAPVVAPAPTGDGLPAPEKVGDDKQLVSKRLADVPEDTVAAKLLVRLPKDGALLRSTRLLVKGSTDKRNELTVNGEKQTLDENGRFVKVLEVAAGQTKVRIEAKDPAGNIAVIERHYAVDPTGLFVMGIADASAGGVGGELYGTDNVDLKIGGVRRIFLGGRVAGTVSGELPGDRYLGGFFKSLKFSANVDSTRRNDDAAFVDLLDPARFYPVYGDGSNVVQEAPARGPLFARIDADESHALFGDFKTNVGGSELFRYDRTLYGADVTLKRELSPKVATDTQVLAAPGDARVRHGHVELQATGGSVYFLQSGNVVEGTERVRIVVRDRDTGLELTRMEKARYTDYFVSYVEGRLLFKEPVATTAESTFLINNNLSTALGGHPVFIVVDYEYRDVAGNQGGTVGFHTRESFFGGLLQVGGGLLQESRGEASPYRLMGFELGTKKTDRTYANFEFAHTNGTDANSFYSADGGLTYTALARGCLSPSDPACSSSGNAYKFEAAGELADLLNRKGELAQGRLYLQSLGLGFFSNGSLIEQGTLKYGGQIRYPFGPKDAIALKHDSVESVLDRDANTPGIQPKTVIRRMTGLQYRHTEERWGLVGEYANALTSDSGTKQSVLTDTLLAGGNFKPRPDLNLTLTQEGILRGDPALLAGWRDHLTTSIGGQFKLSENLAATLVESVRWSGENATQAGLTTKINDTSNLYLNQRFQDRAGQSMSTTLVGAGVDVLKGTRAYGEYQLDNAVGGGQNRAVLGLNNRWQLRPGLLLSASYERSQVLGAGGPLSQTGITGAAPGATQGSVLGVPPFAAPGLNPGAAISPGASSRDVASAGIELLASPKFKLSARLEGRYDNADPKFAQTVPGIADRLQLVFLSTVDWKWTDDVAFLSRVVYADAFKNAADTTFSKMLENAQLDARYLEATAGFAFRPTKYDWFAALLKVSRVIDRRPLDLSSGAADTQLSDVVSLAPSFETPFHFGFSEKIAYKHVRSQVTGVPEETSHVVLNVNRIDFHVLPQLDVSAEYRFLFTRIGQSTSNPDSKSTPQGDLKHGAVFEVAYRPQPFLRVGAGYNFSSFSDNELVRLDQNAGGFFVRATGQY